MKALALPPGYERRIPIDLTQACWPWSGQVGQHGYGSVMVDGEMKYVHRLVYQLHVGPIPRGWELDHACHSAAIASGECGPGVCSHRACWNPAHIEAVSSRENSLRGGHPLFSLARLQKCRRGHDMSDPANVYARPDGRRRCRVCTLDGQRERRKAHASVVA